MSNGDSPIKDEISYHAEGILRLLTSMASPSHPVKETLCQLATDFCPNVKAKQIKYDLNIRAMKEEEALNEILKEWVKVEGDGATPNKFLNTLSSKCSENISDSSSSPVAGPTSRENGNGDIRKSKSTSTKRQIEENAEESGSQPKRKIQKGTPPITENWSEKLKRLSKLALELLNRMTYLSPDDIPQDLLDQLLPINNKLGGTSSASILAKCSLIKKKKLKGKIVYSIPSGLQEYLKYELVKEEREGEILNALLQRFEKINRSKNHQENAKVYVADNIEHAFSIWKYAVNYDQLVEFYSDQLCDIYSLLEDSKRDLQEKGIEFGVAALAKFKTALGLLNRDSVKLEKNIAVVGYLLGKCEESAKKLNELGKKYGEVVAEDDDLLLVIKAEEAEALALLGRYDEALEIQLPVWEITRNKSGEAACETLLAEFRYATSVWKTGKLKEALEMFKWLVEKELRAKNDASHDCVLKAEMHLALVYSDMGESLEALKILKDTYEKITSKPGTMDVELYAKIACNLGEVLLDLKNFTEAEGYLKHAYEIVEDFFGFENCLTLRILKAWGTAYRGDGKNEKELKMALDMHKKAYQGFIDLEEEKEENEEALSAKDEVAIDLSFLRRHEEAKKMFKDIIEEMKRLKGDPDLLVGFLINYAEALERSGKTNEEVLGYLKEVKEELELDKTKGNYLKRVQRVDEVIKRIEGKEVL